MNRYGTNASWLGRICKHLQSEKGVVVQGFYSHLCCNKVASAYKSRSLFLQMQKVVLRYYPSAICHLSATFGASLGQDFAFDMVRVGIGLYGYLPCGTDKEFAKRARLKKAMQVFAQVTASRQYSFGGGGYGKEKAPIKKGAPMHVLRFGYADGFLRNKQNGAVGAKKSVNALCMDATVRRGKAKRGAWQAVLVDAEKTAKEQNTIVYEVLCRMGQRAERIYENGEIDDGERWLGECEKRKKATARIYEKTPRR
jgi:alanine racemase